MFQNPFERRSGFPASEKLRQPGGGQPGGLLPRHGQIEAVGEIRVDAVVDGDQPGNGVRTIAAEELVNECNVFRVGDDAVMVAAAQQRFELSRRDGTGAPGAADTSVVFQRLPEAVDVARVVELEHPRRTARAAESSASSRPAASPRKTTLSVSGQG